jgi:hypothetical protein
LRSQPAANPDGFFLLSVLLVFLRFLLNLFAAALNVLAGALDCIAAGKPGEEDLRRHHDALFGAGTELIDAAERLSRRLRQNFDGDVVEEKSGHRKGPLTA